MRDDTEATEKSGWQRGAKIAAVAVLALAIAAVWFRAVRAPESFDAPLLVGTNVWPGYEPFYLARDLGLYEGDDVRFVEYRATTQVIRAFRNATLDAAALTLDEVLLMRDYGIDAAVVLVTDISDGADVILARPEFESMEALRGRPIGVENSALGAYVLTRALQLNGMEPDDVRIVSMPVDEQRRAFGEGRVDAVVTFDPVRSRLLRRGARLIFDSSRIPGEIVDVLAVRREALARDDSRIEAVLHGWFHALEYMRDRPEDAARRMSRRLRLDPGEVMDAFAGMVLPGPSRNLEMLRCDENAPLRRSVERLAGIMRANDLMRSAPPGSCLAAAAPLERFIAEHPGARSKPGFGGAP